MAQSPAAIFKIPAESAQPACGRASRAHKLAAAQPKAAGRVAGIETRTATRGDGEVIELDRGITVYPPKDKGAGGGRSGRAEILNARGPAAADAVTFRRHPSLRSERAAAVLGGRRGYGCCPGKAARSGRSGVAALRGNSPAYGGVGCCFPREASLPRMTAGHFRAETAVREAACRFRG